MNQKLLGLLVLKKKIILTSVNMVRKILFRAIVIDVNTIGIGWRNMNKL